MSLPKYKYLLTYRYAEMICDLGVDFSRCFYLSNLRNLGNLSDLSEPIPVRRTVEQFTQALRSGKQNIIEGVSEVASLKSQIKLLGIAAASFEEAIADLEDFLRQRGLKIFPKTDPRIAEYQKTGYRFSNLSNLSILGNLSSLPKLPENPEEAANFLLTFLHIETYLLSKQIKSAENKFLTEGGYTENLYEAPRAHARGFFSAQLHSKSCSADYLKLSSSDLRPRFSAFADKKRLTYRRQDD